MINPFRDICDRLLTNSWGFVPAAADELRRMSPDQYTVFFQSLTSREKIIFDYALQTADLKSREYSVNHDSKVKNIALSSLAQIRQIKQLHELFKENLGGSSAFFRDQSAERFGLDEDILIKALSVQDEIPSNFKRFKLLETLARIAPEHRDEALGPILFILKQTQDSILSNLISAVSDEDLPSYLQNLHTLLRNVPAADWRQINDLLDGTNRKAAAVNSACRVIPQLTRQNTNLVIQVLGEIIAIRNFHEMVDSVQLVTQMCQDGHHLMDLLRILTPLDPHDRQDIATRTRQLAQGTSECFILRTLSTFRDLSAQHRALFEVLLQAALHNVRRDDYITTVLNFEAVRSRFFPNEGNILDALFHNHGPRNRSYELALGRVDFEKHPIQSLDSLVQLFKVEVKQKLKVQILGEPGLDAGGLAQELISEIPRGACRLMQMARCDTTGLFRPNCERLTCEQEEVHRNLGQLFMFCLTASKEYLIGQEFDMSLFQALKLLKERHLVLPFDSLVEDERAFHELFEIFAIMNAEHSQDKIKVAAMRKEGRSEGVLDAMRAELVPCIEIKKGMLASLFPKNVLEQLTAEQLSEKLQGKLSSQLIISKLHFNQNIAREHRDWIRSWLQGCTTEQLKDFLYAATAARSIGNKQVSIEPSGDDLPHFHTCFNSMELPFHTITSEQQMHKLLKRAVKLANFYSMI